MARATHSTLIFSLLAAMSVGCGSQPVEPFAPNSAGKINVEWLVRFEPGADAAQVAVDFLAVLSQYDSAADLGVLIGPIDPVALVADLRVRAVQENHVVGFSRPVDVTQGFYEGGWEPDVIAGQPALAPLNLDVAHRYRRGRDILVAVLDTGVEIEHEHLSGRLLLTAQVPPDLGQQETNNGLDEDVDGETDEAFGHGTHVAGIVLAVAPEARVLPIKVLNDDGVGFAFNLCRGLFYAKDLGADIVNLSLVLSNDSAVVAQFLEEMAAAQIAVVCAAGNTPGTVGYPASDPNCIGVAATKDGSQLAAFSGAGNVALAAPGVAIESSFPGNGSAFGTGTSMATPVVCGSLALLRCMPGMDPEVATSWLELTASLVTPVGSVVYGRVDPVRVVVPSRVAKPRIRLEP